MEKKQRRIEVGQATYEKIESKAFPRVKIQQTLKPPNALCTGVYERGGYVGLGYNQTQIQEKT